MVGEQGRRRGCFFIVNFDMFCAVLPWKEVVVVVGIGICSFCFFLREPKIELMKLRCKN